MVDHQFCHPAVDTDIFAGDEPRFIRAQIQNHVGDIQRVADPASRLLDSIWALVYLMLRVDPAGRNGIDTNLSGKAHCQRVCQGVDASLRRGVPRLAVPAS